MKLGKAHIKNFGAYKELEFDFENQGLALISGPTKTGKSTVMDMACWILYGATSKESAADDMKSWFADGPTEGRIEVCTTTGKITVFRIRGSAHDNDLYWYEEYQMVEQRGKDLKDTQRLLEERLGVSAELYIIGSYMHQFSSGDIFFTAKAKDRREVLEKLADLSLPIKLGNRASDRRKEKKKELEALNQDKAKLEGRLEQVVLSLNSNVESWEKWETERGHKILELEKKSQAFETIRKNNVHSMVSKVEELSRIAVDPAEIIGRMNQIKTQIKSLEQAKVEYKTQNKIFVELESEYLSLKKEFSQCSELSELGKCPTCESPLKNNSSFSNKYSMISSIFSEVELKRIALSSIISTLECALSTENKVRLAYDKCRQDEVSNERMLKEINELRAKIVAAKSDTNRYSDDIAALRAQANPHEAQIATCNKNIEELQTKIGAAAQTITDIEHLIASLSWLYDKSFELRASMLERAKNEIVKMTNAYLERHFDAELRINLAFEGSDKLNVEIINEGYPCPYKQLSGGERCMLKLAFSLSLMKRAEDVAGVKFSTIMLDEALNGLDASLKSKAYNLLQTLENEYSTILLIDHHEEFKSLFTNQYHVVKENGASVLTHE